MMNKQKLIDNGFKLIGIKENGLKIYARKNVLGDSGIVLHKVNANGESLGVENFEVETIKILMKSDLV